HARAPLSGGGVWREGAAPFVDGERLGQRRKSALRASGPLAHFAAGADQRARRGIAQRQPLGIDQSFGVEQIAAKADRELLGRRAIPSARALYRARDPEIGATVGHLRYLRQNLAGMGERVI